VLLENGERLAAVAAVRSCENRLMGARGGGGGSAAALLQRVIAGAGAACMPQVGRLCPLLVRGSCMNWPGLT
jgi:hypothetical protein